eukprot:tig00021312_g20049.t1
MDPYSADESARLFAAARSAFSVYTADAGKQAELFPKLFDEKAVFEDGIMRAEGLERIQKQFYILACGTSNIRVEIRSVAGSLSGVPGQGRLIVDNVQYYTLRGLPLTAPVRVVSIIDFNAEGKVSKLEDCFVVQDLIASIPLVGYFYHHWFKNWSPRVVGWMARMLGSR